MNILFVNHLRPIKMSGGIETVTGTLSESFLDEGHSVYCLWSINPDINSSPFRFTLERQIEFNDDFLSNFLGTYNIDYIIIQAFYEAIKPIAEAIRHSPKQIPVTFVLHSLPAWELKTLPSIKQLYRDMSGGKFKAIIKLLSYPLYKYFKKTQTINKYRCIYNQVDGVILLSTYYIPNFKRIARIKDESKFCCIPNPCLFNEILSPSLLEDKEERVLIVSRLIESKKISLALKIWKGIENNVISKNWVLDIIGTGPQEKQLKDLAIKLGLKRVHFYGKQSPMDFYKRSTIFLMTSEYEGFPLTLVESQFYGCIPMAFSSFPALKEIISSGKNGLAIPYPDIEEYTSQLLFLISNPTKRKEMANHALNDVEKYSIKNITYLWIEYLKRLTEKQKNNLQSNSFLHKFKFNV